MLRRQNVPVRRIRKKAFEMGFFGNDLSSGGHALGSFLTVLALSSHTHTRLVPQVYIPLPLQMLRHLVEHVLRVQFSERIRQPRS